MEYDTGILVGCGGPMGDSGGNRFYFDEKYLKFGTRFSEALKLDFN